MLGEHSLRNARRYFRCGRKLGLTFDRRRDDFAGGFGAGKKTILPKAFYMRSISDTREVTSPSFTLVNLYKTGRL